MHSLPGITIRKLYVSIQVSDNGTFYAYDPDEIEIANAPGYDKLISMVDKKLRAHKRVRIAVPFTTELFQPAIAIGKHGRTGAILTHIDDGTIKGQSGSMYGYESRRVLKPNLSQSAIEELKKLKELHLKLEKRLDRWNDRNHFNLNDAVNDEIKKRTETP